ncbi:DUF433 domain-containing protein [Sorangium sp. So ce394]|uniref:DUF433 domain-containing protein n=1 Tax=unclassified Sorangium TaxID=2621164 RepID=UPI003F5B35E3
MLSPEAACQARAVSPAGARADASHSQNPGNSPDRSRRTTCVCPDAGHGPSLDRIFVAPNVCVGRAYIRRHRIWASLAIDLLASGMSVQDVIAEHRIEEDDVLACIAYGAVTFGWQVCKMGGRGKAGRLRPDPSHHSGAPTERTMTRAEPAQRRRQSWISSHVSQSN